MHRLRNLFRTVTLSAALAIGLGCTGMMTSAMNMAGIEMRVGADAVHPPDFPAMPLTVGEKSLSMKMTARGDQVNLPPDVPMPPDMPLDKSIQYDIEVVVYSVPSADRAEAVAQAVVQVLSAGYVEVDAPPAAEGDIQELHLSTNEASKSVFTIIGTDDGNDSAVVFVRLSPHSEEAPTGNAPTAPASKGEGE